MLPNLLIHLPTEFFFAHGFIKFFFMINKKQKSNSIMLHKLIIHVPTEFYLANGFITILLKEKKKEKKQTQLCYNNLKFIAK